MYFWTRWTTGLTQLGSSDVLIRGRPQPLCPAVGPQGNRLATVCWTRQAMGLIQQGSSYILYLCEDRTTVGELCALSSNSRWVQWGLKCSGEVWQGHLLLSVVFCLPKSPCTLDPEFCSLSHLVTVVLWVSSKYASPAPKVVFHLSSLPPTPPPRLILSASFPPQL